MPPTDVRSHPRSKITRASCTVAAALLATLANGALAVPPPLAVPEAPTAPAPSARLDPTQDPPQAEPLAVDRDYDRFQDKTTIRVEGVRPQITRGESRLFINATSSADGTEVTVQPTKVQLNVLAVSDDFQYADLKDGLQFILLINGSRVRVPAKFVKAGTSRDRAAHAMESFVAIIDADVLVQMATARTVEGQLGAAEFKLGAMEQLSLRRFAEAVKLLAPLPSDAPGNDALRTATQAGPVRVDAVALHLAQARIDELQEKVDRLTAACLTKLAQNKDYLAACDSAAELESKKDKAPAGPQRAAVSQQWLEARARVSLLKSSALLDDADLAAARRELTDAQSAMKAMQRAHDRAAPSSASR